MFLCSSPVNPCVPFLTQSQETTSFVCSGFLYTWNTQYVHFVSGFFFLESCFWDFSRLLYKSPVCSFCCWVIFCYLQEPRFAYSSSRRRAFGSLPMLMKWWWMFISKFCAHIFLFFLVPYLGVGLPDDGVRACLTLWEPAKPFSEVVELFSTLTSSAQEFHLLQVFAIPSTYSPFWL